jgi:hypothetical protein
VRKRLTPRSSPPFAAACIGLRWGLLLAPLHLQPLFALGFPGCNCLFGSRYTLRWGHIARRLSAALRAKLAQICFELLFSWGHVPYILLISNPANPDHLLKTCKLG